MKPQPSAVTWIGILVIVLHLCSCVDPGIGANPVVSTFRQKENTYYVPSSPNTPLSNRRGDAAIQILHSSQEYFGGVDLQGGYVVNKHVGLIANGSFGKHEVDEKLMNYSRVEFGAGYLAPVTKQMHFETYGGIGFSNVKNNHVTGTSRINQTSYFVQPAFVISNHRRTVNLGLISKLSGVNFTVKDYFLDHAREPFSAQQLGSFIEQPFHFIWEPGIMFRFGWENFKFQLAYFSSKDLSDVALHKSNGNLNLGVSFQFNAFDTKKTNQTTK